MRLFKNTNIDFIGKRKIWYYISAIFVTIGILAPLFKGLNYGIDFIGGTEIVVSFDKQIDLGKVRSASSKWGIGSVELKTFGTVANNIIIRTALQDIDKKQFENIKSKIDSKLKSSYNDTVYSVLEKTPASIIYRFPNNDFANEAADKLFYEGFQAGALTKELTNQDVIVRIGVEDLINEGLKASFPDYKFEIIKSDKVGPKVGSELRVNALLAVIFSLIAILVYIGFRFKFVFGLGALLALAHDVLITLGFIVIFDGLFGLNLEMNQQMIAAFLTLVGFSVNDTVVVFDRIRENMKIHKTLDLKELMNISINRTLSRTILTSGTVFLVVLVLLFLGGEVNQGFAFAFAIGTITGTYSSIYIASTLVYEISIRSKKKMQF